MTALMKGAQEGHLAIVELLLSARADVNTQSNKGNSALINACMAQDPPVSRSAALTLQLVARLLKGGAKPNLASCTGATALIIASGIGNLPAVELLLDHSADPRLQMYQGGTALECASQRHNKSVVKVLQNALLQNSAVAVQPSADQSDGSDASEEEQDDDGSTDPAWDPKQPFSSFSTGCVTCGATTGASFKRCNGCAADCPSGSGALDGGHSGRQELAKSRPYAIIVL